MSLREAGVQAAVAELTSRGSPRASDGEVVLAMLGERGIDALRTSDATYPRRLRDLPHPPTTFFTWGDQALLHAPAVGMCGSRDASASRLEAAAVCGEEVARAGFAVVSGYARGVDTETHLSALRAGQPGQR